MTTYSLPSLTELFPFPLDEFQLQAIAALDAGKSVVVCAPTGSGKTVIGEYALYRALKRGKRVFYTTPLKALSNQKVRDFQDKLSHLGVNDAADCVGLITGDLVVNANAPIVVMTTEIFRNMLYETPIGEVGTSLEEVETVVFDECHYISDRDRGTVWEESIIYCPATIQLVALSATIGNPEQLTDWINQVRQGKSLKQLRRSQKEDQQHCELINSNYRPVPLHFHFSAKNGLFPLLNEDFTGVNHQLLAKKHQEPKKRLRREDCPYAALVVEQLRERDFLPAIYVIFSRKGCEQAVQSLQGFNLVSLEESQVIQLTLLRFFLGNDPDLRNRLRSDFGRTFPDFCQQILAFLAEPTTEGDRLLALFQEQAETTLRLWQWLAQSCPMIRFDQIEPLIRGLAVHHAGVLPSWKELVERLFEQGLIKVVFATATLSAGINMPARTTVISSLSKRTDKGIEMLSPSEFVQIAGRAGRRGMDEAGQVVTVQTPFEGAKEAALLALASPENLRSCFTPSYGMVLNLLQKHTLAEAKDLMERSFAEYLMQLALEPTQQAIADLFGQLAQLDFKLAGVKETDIRSYEKFRARLREEERLLKTLEQQAEKTRRQEIVHQLSDLFPGQCLHLKGKFIRVGKPIFAIFIRYLPSAGKFDDLLCLSGDNRWYRATVNDVYCLSVHCLPGIPSPQLNAQTLPDVTLLKPGKFLKGKPDTNDLAQQLGAIADVPQPAPEILEQQERVNHVKQILETHSFNAQKNPQRVIEQYYQRLTLREELEKRQNDLIRLQSRQSYYWQEFLDLITVLQHFSALEDLSPTPLGEAAATVRGENELWLGLVLMSGKLNHLAPHHLAAAISGLITESLRPDTWTNFSAPPEVLEALRPTKDLATLYFFLRSPMNFTVEVGVYSLLIYYLGRINLWEVRRELFQTQKRHNITMPAWLEIELLGLIEQWALGMTWDELIKQTSLDEGDMVRLLRRTIDLLWQIPQIPRISETLKRNAKAAIALIKRFPV